MHSQRPTFALPKYWLLFLAILTFYFILIAPTLSRMGIGWDEEVDLRITRVYSTLRGLLLGTSLDLSQTRLPMFVVGLVYRLFGVSNLLLARWTSVVMGGLTILGIYVYGKNQINSKVGLLAAGLLAINPFFLSFARLAFTESDIYLACTFTWLLFAFAHLLEKPTVGRAAVVGLFLGLSISAKAMALVIIPAVWVVLFFVRFYKSNAGHAKFDAPIATKLPTRAVWLWVTWAILVFLASVFVARFLDIGTYSGLYRTLNYGVVGLGWLLPLAWAYRHRNQYADSIPLAAFITGLGLLTFVIIPPEHLTNSGIIRSLLSRAENEMSLSAAFIGELTALHLLTLFFKSTPLLGFALFAGTVSSLTDWRQRELMMPLFMAVCYFAGLLLLPLGQTFYTIPILPVLSLLAANQFLRLWSLRRKIALAVAVFTMGWWGVEMIQCYPDYHLNGYQWVGERVLFGRSSIGYASVVFTPEDGVQQAMEWLNENAESGQVAQLYFNEWHIVQHVAPDPDYLLNNGFEETLSSRPDFVAIHINALHAQGFGIDTPEGDINLQPFDCEILEQEYEQVFVVERAFDLEVASVWQKR